MAKTKEYEQEITLNENTKIKHRISINEKNENNRFIICNNDKEIIIKFCKTKEQYDILVCFMDTKEEKYDENELLLSNSTYLDSTYPAYEYLRTQSQDGSINEEEKYIDLKEKDILNEIHFIITYTNHFNNDDILKAYEIVASLIKPFINDFINIKNKKHIKELVRNN